MKQITLNCGAQLPVIGQGTWFLGDHPERRDAEIAALRAGVEAGMYLIDSAEMYGGGRSERLVGEAIRPLERKSLFLVSKVLPSNAGRRNIFKSCEASLRAFGTDYLDLYLLHWRGGVPLAETVACMEELKKNGLIRQWGVSNFDTDDMQELFSIKDGKNCQVNQVLYHMASRGIEYDLLPWMQRQGVALMAYCPLAQGGSLRRGLMENPALGALAQARGITVSQLLLAFAIHNGDTVAIPRSGQAAHTLQNAAAAQIVLTDAELEAINQQYAPPKRKTYLDIV